MQQDPATTSQLQPSSDERSGTAVTPDQRAADWSTIWQSELTALAEDPELGEVQRALQALASPPGP